MKRTIKIKESDLHRMVENSVRKALNEFTRPQITDTFPFDLSKIDPSVLKSVCRDLLRTPCAVTYDSFLSPAIELDEALHDILPPDTVMMEISKRYNYPLSLIYKQEVHNNIYVYVLVANIGQNVSAIEDDMKRMGYFVGSRLQRTDANGIPFVAIQFEPSYQILNDETDNIKSKYQHLYHWTPKYNLPSVLQRGLIPQNGNTRFNYPPRIYLIKGDAPREGILRLGEALSVGNGRPENNGEYTLLSINIHGLNDDVRLYYDSNTSIGIFTECPIPPHIIKVVEEIKFQIFKPKL